MIAIGSQYSGQLFLFLVTCCHSSLDVIKKYLCVSAMEGVNARSRWTTSTAFKAKQLSIETVATE
jgi:hypothetical protein